MQSLHLILAMLMIAPLTSCKSTKRENRAPDQPFAHSSTLFEGTYQRFQSSYYFDQAKSYVHTINHRYGSVQEHGTIALDTDKSIIKFTPEYFVCQSDQKNIRISISAFRKIAVAQKERLIDAYARSVDDPDGLKDLLQRFQDAKLENENIVLGQELAKEMVAQEISTMQDFLAMIASMHQKIQEQLATIAEHQDNIDKKQKEIDLILQEKIEFRSRIPELNIQEEKLINERDEGSANIQLLVQEVELTRKKIALLLSEQPISEDDLNRSLAHLGNIDEYLKYAKERTSYIESNEEFLVNTIQDNRSIISSLETFAPTLGRQRSFYFQISSVRLHLDNSPVNASSPGFEAMNGEAPSNYVAECYQSALILMTNFLEEEQQIPAYRQDSE